MAKKKRDTVDHIVESLFKELASGVQFMVMDLGKLHQYVRDKANKKEDGTMTTLMTDVHERARLGMIEAIAKYRKN